MPQQSDPITAKIEALLRKLPQPPQREDGSEREAIPYESLMPGIVRELTLLAGTPRPTLQTEVIEKRVAAIKKHADALNADLRAMTSLPLQWRAAILVIAQEEIPSLTKKAGKGAPVKHRARKAARIMAQHFFGLTGASPARITDHDRPPSAFVDLLTTIFAILGIDAKADSQAKTAIQWWHEARPAPVQKKPTRQGI
jgi:hypothetical protein